jgi:hypothetical protein
MARLDDLSVAIGDIQSSLRTLFKRADEDREDQAKRHAANQEAIGELRQTLQLSNSELRQSAVDRWNAATAAIEQVAKIATARDDTMTTALADLSRELKEHSDVVANMEPRITSLQISRGKLAALAGVGILSLWVIGQAAEAGFNQLLAWAFKKIGGP